MALNPTSYLQYLQSWENNLAAAHHRYRRLYAETDSGEEDEAYHDLPESSSSSASFISRFSQSSLGRRLNFHYYPGAEVTHSDVPSLGETNGPDSQLNIGELERTSGFKSTAAFEVSRGKRIGIIYGFAALKPVLVEESVYKCSTEDTVCYTQELRLNLIFAVASATLSVSTLPIGAILTTYGPGVGNMIGNFFLAFGALLLSFGASLPFDAYIPGFVLLGLGAPFIYASSLHLVNAFPTHSTLILSAFTGAFDSSNALFLVFRVVNEKTGFSIRAFSLFYLTVPLFIVVMQLSIMPRTLYKTPGELVLQAETCVQSHGPAGQGQCSVSTYDRNIIQNTQTLLNDTGDLFRTKHALSISNQAQSRFLTSIHARYYHAYENHLSAPRASSYWVSSQPSKYYDLITS
ncbi:MFS transporter Fmp42 [Aspergillus sp. HF37]|nr:MFS transporter Fmp42 [Aspergillus sp. HF37]